MVGGAPPLHVEPIGRRKGTPARPHNTPAQGPEALARNALQRSAVTKRAAQDNNARDEAGSAPRMHNFHATTYMQGLRRLSPLRCSQQTAMIPETQCRAGGVSSLPYLLSVASAPAAARLNSPSCRSAPVGVLTRLRPGRSTRQPRPVLDRGSTCSAGCGC